jgi:hypothetical protein
MRNTIRRGLVLTALAGSCVMAAGPAALAQATQSPEGIALDATGPVALGPIADAHGPTFPNTVSVVGVTLPGLLVIGSTSTSALTSTVTEPSATNNTATSAIDRISSVLTLPVVGGLLAGTTVASSCVWNNGTFTETTTIESLTILGQTITIPATIPANDTLIGLPSVLGLTLSVTLNQQVPGPGGSQTVNAIAVSLGDSLIGNGTENIYLASSTCGPFTGTGGTPLASGAGLGIGLGLLGLLGAGLGAFYIRRRNTLQVA